MAGIVKGAQPSSIPLPELPTAKQNSSHAEQRSIVPGQQGSTKAKHQVAATTGLRRKISNGMRDTKPKGRRVQPQTTPNTTRVPSGRLAPARGVGAIKARRFGRRLNKIQRHTIFFINHLKHVAKSIRAGGDQLHTLGHCIRLLQLNTFGSLESILASLENSTINRDWSQDETHLVWAESTVPAAHMWAVKSILRSLQVPEVETEVERLKLKAQLRRAWEEAQYLNDLLYRTRMRVKPESLGDPPHPNNEPVAGMNEGMNEGDEQTDIVSPGRTPQPTRSADNTLNPGFTISPIPDSTLLKNLASVVAHAKKESAVWKIERFISRIEEIYKRTPRIVELLDQLAQELQVNACRTHPLVASRHTLQLDTFGSLGLTLRILRKRTPKDAVELPQNIVTAVRAEARLPEVQMKVVKAYMRIFYDSTKEMELTRQQKDQVRSIRGRIKIVHGLIQSSRNELASLRDSNKDIGGLKEYFSPGEQE